MRLQLDWPLFGCHYHLQKFSLFRVDKHGKEPRTTSATTNVLSQSKLDSYKLLKID